jgi:hypothetical protein
VTWKTLLYVIIIREFVDTGANLSPAVLRCEMVKGVFDAAG